MKLDQLLFWLLILLLPTQLGKHFWPDWSLVNGLRVDYLSPTIYLTDLIIFGLLITWVVENVKNIKHQISNIKNTNKKLNRYFFLFSSFLVFLLVNSFLAQNQPAAFYKLAKLVEFVLLGIYIAQSRPSLNTFSRLLSISIVYSSLLAIAQFLNQGSLGGIFYWLGERAFNAGTPGIAQVIINGQLVLRPYASFPHPNVLAGFLVVSLIIVLWVKPKFCWFSLISGIITLFLTFSRVAWAVLVLGVMGYALALSSGRRGLWVKRRNNLLFIGLLVFIGSLGIYFSPIQPESITYRQDLNAAAIKMIQSSPLLGVGLNNFLVKLPEFYQTKSPVYFLQPAHNFYLMVGAEIGLIGVIGLISFLILTYRRLLLTTNYLLLTTLSVLLALGFFDHYFYTLSQGQLLLTLVLGLAWSVQVKDVKMAL